jgi:hypothetical protein
VTRRIFTLVNNRLRDRAIECIREAFEKHPGSRVEVKGPKRSSDANAAMWCKLGDIAEQLTWHGRKLDTEAWKLVMLDALRRHYSDERQLMNLVPNIDGTGFVNIGQTHSSDLSGEEMHDLLTIISAFGDQQGVEWSEPKPKGDTRPVPPVEAYEEIA